MPDFASPCHLASHVALPVVRFNDSPDYVNIPLRGEARQVHTPSRKYERQFPITNPPKADVQDVKDALTSAKMLKATLDACESGVSARCGYECSTEFGCSRCIPKNINATCAAAVSNDGQHLDIEWIADTGSAQDLISKDDLNGLRSYTAPHPINIITANGPSAADVQADIKVPSLGITSTPYVLPSTPLVLTVGYRCMEEGFDFVWRAYQRPFFRDSEGNKTYMDVRDYVPYLKSWKESTAVPARRKHEPPVPSLPIQDDSVENIDRGTEVDNERNADDIRNETGKVSLQDKVSCDRSDSSAEADAIAAAMPATLPDESMSLHRLHRKRNQNRKQRQKPMRSLRLNPSLDQKALSQRKARLEVSLDQIQAHRRR